MIRVAYIAAAIILLVLTYIFFPPIPTSGDLGLCLSSPNQWKLPHFAGWCINCFLIFLSAGMLDVANKKYNFVSEAHEILPLALLVLLVCAPLSTFSLSTSTLLLCVNVFALYVLIG